MQATWRGYISLGMVGFPVQLFNATTQARPKFTQLHKKDLSPIERVAFCREENKEISSSDIVRGVKKGDSFVPVTNQELERVAGPRLQTIEIRQFCLQNEIDIAYYNRPYYIVPGDGGMRAYTLIREALLKTKKVAVSQLVLHGKEYVAVIRPLRGILMLHLLRFAAELVPRTDIKTPPLDKPTPQELEAGVALVERFSSPFFIEDFKDTETEQMRELVDRKVKGLPPPKRAVAAPVATEDDELLDALTSTLEGDGQKHADRQEED
jgi:DNA end-binding protein Ku